MYLTRDLSQLLPLFDVDHLEIVYYSNLTIVFYSLGNFGQVLCIRLCHEDLILTRKSHNCAEIVFIQSDSAGGSKLIEQTLPRLPNKLNNTPVYSLFSVQSKYWKVAQRLSSGA